MGIFDDWKTRLLGRAAAESAKKAARSVTDAVSRFGDELATDLEKQLSDAQASQKPGMKLPDVHPDVEIPQMPEDPTKRRAPDEDPGHARRAREAREASAKDELARMKAELKAKIDAHARASDEET